MTYRLAIAALFVFVGLRAQGASAAEAPQASFDCNKAASPIEKTICSNGDLAAEDRAMAAAFAKILETAPTRSRAAITLAQRRWLRTLSERCNSSNAMLRCVKWHYWDWLHDEPRKLANISRVMAMVARIPTLPSLSLDRDPGLCRRLEQAARDDFERPSDIDAEGGMQGPESRMSVSGARWIDLSEGGIGGGEGAMLILPGSAATAPAFGVVLQARFMGWIENYRLFLIKATDLPAVRNDLSSSLQKLDTSKPLFETWSRSDTPFGLLRIGGDIYLADQDAWKTLTLSKITANLPPQPTCVVTYGPTPSIGPDFDRWIAEIGAVQGQEGPNSGSGHFIDARRGTTRALATLAASRPSDVILRSLDGPERVDPRQQLDSAAQSRRGVELWGLMGPWNHVHAERLQADSAPALAALARFYVVAYGMTKDDAALAATHVTDAIWQASLYFYRFGEGVEQGAATPAAIDADLRRQADAFATSPDASDANDLIRPAILVGAQKADIAAMMTNGAELGSISATIEPVLFFALERPEIVRLLIEHGADINATNAFGKTALMYAAQFDQYGSVDLLLKAKADVNAATNEPPGDVTDIEYNMSRTKRSALMYAAENARPRVINRLIDAGADVHAVDSFGKEIAFYLERNPLLQRSEKDALESRIK